MSLLLEQINNGLGGCNDSTHWGYVTRRVSAIRSLGSGLKRLNSPQDKQEYIEKCLAIHRPDNLSIKHLCFDPSVFDEILECIKSWEVYTSDIAQIRTATVKPSAEALLGSFFYNPKHGFFAPSNWYMLIKPDEKIQSLFESRASEVSTREVAFDDLAIKNKLPAIDDPFVLDRIDLESKDRILLGDKVMLLTLDSEDNIIFEIASLSYELKNN